MRQTTVIKNLLQSATEVLLQSASGITKCDSYYKVRRGNTSEDTLKVMARS